MFYCIDDGLQLCNQDSGEYKYEMIRIDAKQFKISRTRKWTDIPLVCYGL